MSTSAIPSLTNNPIVPPPGALSFFVPGKAQPAGSKRYVGQNKRTGKALVVDDCEGSAAWKKRCKMFARMARTETRAPILRGAIGLVLHFHRLRPASHFRTGANRHLLRQDAPAYPTVKPDVLKLARAVEDGCTCGKRLGEWLDDGLWEDDALIVREAMAKDWSEKEGVEVTVWELPDGAADCGKKGGSTRQPRTLFAAG